MGALVQVFDALRIRGAIHRRPFRGEGLLLGSRANSMRVPASAADTAPGSRIGDAANVQRRSDLRRRQGRTRCNAPPGCRAERRTVSELPRVHSRPALTWESRGASCRRSRPHFGSLPGDSGTGSVAAADCDSARMAGGIGSPIRVSSSRARSNPCRAASRINCSPESRSSPRVARSSASGRGAIGTWGTSSRRNGGAALPRPGPSEALAPQGHDTEVEQGHTHALLTRPAIPLHRLDRVFPDPSPCCRHRPRRYCAVDCPCSAALRYHRTAAAGSRATPSPAW